MTAAERTTQNREVKYFNHSKRQNTFKGYHTEGGNRRLAKGRQRYRGEHNIMRWANSSLSVCASRARDREPWVSISADLHCGIGFGT